MISQLVLDAYDFHNNNLTLHYSILKIKEKRKQPTLMILLKSLQMKLKKQLIG